MGGWGVVVGICEAVPSASRLSPRLPSLQHSHTATLAAASAPPHPPPHSPPQTKLLLMTLLRLSPIMPFTFSNYLTGLSSLPPAVIFAGTMLGTLPTQFVYVTAGERAHASPRSDHTATI